jgi:hypothetical protein
MNQVVPLKPNRALSLDEAHAAELQSVVVEMLRPENERRRKVKVLSSILRRHDSRGIHKFEPAKHLEWARAVVRAIPFRQDELDELSDVFVAAIGRPIELSSLELMVSYMLDAFPKASLGNEHGYMNGIQLVINGENDVNRFETISVHVVAAAVRNILAETKKYIPTPAEFLAACTTALGRFSDAIEMCDSVSYMLSTAETLLILKGELEGFSDRHNNDVPAMREDYEAYLAEKAKQEAQRVEDMARADAESKMRLAKWKAREAERKALAIAERQRSLALARMGTEKAIADGWYGPEWEQVADSWGQEQVSK